MILIRVWGTTVRARLLFILPLLFVLWGGLSWIGWHWHPGRTWQQSLLIGLAATVLLLLAEFGHPFGHLLSARCAGAPMDELQITDGMPRTLYWNNDVSPDAHRLRALGGLIFNAVGLLVSAAVFVASPGRPVARELAAWSAFGQGLLLIMSLFPVPPVDGGTLLKWTLVARGRTPAQADAVVKRIDRWIAAIAAGMGVLCLAAGMWLAGAILLGIGAIVFGIVIGWIQ